MKKYHKINSIFKRDPKTKKFIDNQYSLPEFELLKDIRWRFDEKLDGSNGSAQYTSYQEEGVFKLKRTINGRTEKANILTQVIQKMEILFPSDCQNIISIFGEPENDNFSLQLFGEFVGKKIQKNGHQYLVKQEDEADFILFDVRIGHIWLTRESIEKIAKNLNIRTAPIVGYGTLKDAVETCKAGFESKIREAKPEGLICRPETELLDRRSNRIITKVKLCDFT